MSYGLPILSALAMSYTWGRGNTNIALVYTALFVFVLGCTLWSKKEEKILDRQLAETRARILAVTDKLAAAQLTEIQRRLHWAAEWEKTKRDLLLVVTALQQPHQNPPKNDKPPTREN